MKKLCMFAALLCLLVSCESLEEKAQKKVEGFIEAAARQDMATAKSIYPNCGFLSDEFNTLDCSKLSQIEITNVSQPIPDLTNCFKVESTLNGASVEWTVRKEENGEPYISSTQGLYRPDIKSVEADYGCKVKITDDASDWEKSNLFNDCVKALKIFKGFADAVHRADTAGIIEIYPELKPYLEYLSLGDSLTLTNCVYMSNDENITLECDSVSFFVSPKSHKIKSSHNFFSPKKLLAEIAALDEEAQPSDGKTDVEYAKALVEQRDNIIEERERKAEEEREEAERQARIAKYKAQGAGLISHSFCTGSKDGNPTKGVRFRIVNLSDREIKYVRLQIVGYNVVDDPVWDGGYMQNVRGIGPVEPGGFGEWEFENIWTSNPSIVHSYEIKTMTVEFKGGGSRTVKLPEILPSDWSDWLD